MQINSKYVRNFDIPIIIAVLALAFIGWLMVTNATGNPDASAGSDILTIFASFTQTTFIINTILWVFLGIAAAAVVMYFDYHTFGAAWKIIYIATCSVLAAVILLGTVAGGTKGWFAKGSIQPSELAKVMMIIVLAKHLSDKPAGIRTVRDMAGTLMMMGIPLILIFLQPDFGTSLVYIFFTVTMLFISGANWKLLIGLVGVGAAAVWPVWQFLPTTQKNRFLALLAPEQVDPSVLYNVKQSTTAVGAGQMTGRGFFAPGSFCQLDYIPEKHTDFIFSITAETWGFIGSLIVIAIYGFLIIRLLLLSRRAFDRFGSYIIIGVMAMFAFHVFENIGMTIGVMPCTGIPLPFMSYGGSSMVTNMIAIGLVENVCMRRRYGMFREGDNY